MMKRMQLCVIAKKIKANLDKCKDVNLLESIDKLLTQNTETEKPGQKNKKGGL